MRFYRESLRYKDYQPDFSCDLSDYEFALGIVEGKPVWKGDRLYYRDYLQEYIHDEMLQRTWPWNPPKQKTVMIELSVKDFTTPAAKP